MADIVQMDQEHFSERSRDAAGVEARNLDARSLLLLAPALLSFIVACSITAYAVLRRLFPQLNLADPRLLEAIKWPAGSTSLRFLMIVFFLLAILLYLAARWQLLHNRSIQAAAGCPSCRQHDLMRVSRSRRDRLFTLGGIRIARYQCRDCRWNGRRIFIRSFHPLEKAPPRDYLITDVKDHSGSDASQAPVYKADGAARPSSDIKTVEPATVPASPTPDNLERDRTIPEAAPDSKGITEPAEEIEAFDKEDDRLEKSPIVIAASENETRPAAGSIEESTRPLQTAEAAESSEANQEQQLNMGNRARIMTTFGVNLRAQPRSDANWVGLLGPETIVAINRSQKREDGTVWYYVMARGQSGWVTESCLEEI